MSLDTCVFCDVGTVSGRLVLTASSLCNFKECRGIEILDNVHYHYIDALQKCYNQHDHQHYLPETTSTSSSKTPLSNVKLELDLFTDPCIKLNDIDMFFVFSSCMSNDI